MSSCGCPYYRHYDHCEKVVIPKLEDQVQELYDNQRRFVDLIKVLKSQLSGWPAAAQELLEDIEKTLYAQE